LETKLHKHGANKKLMESMSIATIVDGDVQVDVQTMGPI
jgi:hypothetical protein